MSHSLVANRSGRSEEMSDRKRIAQVAQDKWATVSDLLRLLMINERMSNSLKKFWLKKSKILFFCMFSIRFFNLKNEPIAHCLFFGEWWTTFSDSLRGNERSWANRSGRSKKMSKWVNRSFFWANRLFAHFLAKNERFARKTDEPNPSPAHSAQGFSYLHIYFYTFLR